MGKGKEVGEGEGRPDLRGGGMETDGQKKTEERCKKGREIGWGRQMGMGKQKRQVVSDSEFRPNCPPSFHPPAPLASPPTPTTPLPSAGTHVEKSEAEVRSRCVKCLG